MKKSRASYRIGLFEVAALDQANPVQNTYYEVFDEKNVRIHGVYALIATTNETLQCKFTIDGVEYESAAQALTADIAYYIVFKLSTKLPVFIGTVGLKYDYARLPEGRAVKLEIRKTTAAGAGNLKCNAMISHS